MINCWKRLPRPAMRLSLVGLARRGSSDPTVIDSGLGKYTTDYSNLPQRYIKKKITKVEWKTPDSIQYQRKMRKFDIPRHTMDRPWTDEFWQKNPAGYKKELDGDKDLNTKKFGKQPIVNFVKEDNWMWFRGDRVEILKGPDKGKQGYINMIVQERNWVTVEGLNCEYKTIGKSKDFPGMMYKEEQPLLVHTDIKLVDPSSEKGCSVEWRFSEDGERVRVAVKSGVVLPLPAKMEETIDYKTKKGYYPNDIKDTLPGDVEEVTYEPKLATFEMDIMESMGIKEDRIAAKSWWY